VSEASLRDASFTGFPAGARATAVPSAFFSELLPRIQDPAELRLTLYLFYALNRRKGYPRFVTERELASEAPLMAALSEGNDDQAQLALEKGIALALERGSLLGLPVEHEGRAETLLFLNTPADRRALAQVRDGRLPLGRPLPVGGGTPAAQRSNLFQLYEDNIGPLTPLVAQELREAEQLYPAEWIEEAMRESALLNKRSWRYMAAILRRWATEGRKRETAGRDSDAGNTARAQILRRYREVSGE
jgi:DnaD/phage-associated family protein